MGCLSLTPDTLHSLQRCGSGRLGFVVLVVSCIILWRPLQSLLKKLMGLPVPAGTTFDVSNLLVSGAVVDSVGLENGQLFRSAGFVDVFGLKGVKAKPPPPYFGTARSTITTQGTMGDYGGLWGTR